jgi:thiol-disulfide isomerase/thioredoxin
MKTAALLLVLLTLQFLTASLQVVIEPSILLPEPDPFAPVVTKDGDGVPSLTATTFESFVNSQPLTVVAFTAPWCGFCKKLKPAFAQASAEISAEFPDVMHFARVDCVAESELYDRFKIEGFPSVKLFHYGVIANSWQTKDLSYEAIRNYAREWALMPDVKTGWLHAQTVDDVFELMEYDVKKHAYTSPVPTLLTVLDASRINSDDSRMVLESLANASLKAETKHTRFIITTDQSAMNEFMQITPDCGLSEPPTELPVSRLLTSFDKPDVFLPPAMVRLSDMVAAFVHTWAWPDLVVHSVQNMTYLFQERPGFQNHVLLFADGPPGTVTYDNLYKAALRVGGAYRKKFIMAIVSPDSMSGKAISQALAVTEALPTIRIVSSNAKAKNSVVRYRYAGEDEFSQAAAAESLKGPDVEIKILDFVQKFVSGQLEPMPANQQRQGVEREL